MKTLHALIGLAAAAALGVACSSAPGTDDGEQDVVTQNDCKIFSVKDQKTIEGDDLKKFATDHQSDPVFQKILKSTCPGTYREIQAKLTQQKCNNDLEVRVVSERATQLDTPEESRGLVSRTCGDQSLFFLLDPVSNDVVATECKANTAFDKQTPKCQGGLPNDVEIIGEDTVQGVFQFYAREVRDDDSKNGGNIWKYFGSSKDFVTNGYDCDTEKFNGACQPLAARDPDKGGLDAVKSGVRCASCHPGGGLVEKELNSPWASWMRPPGSNEFVSAYGDVVGQLSDGDAFESTVGQSGMNKTVWTPKRVQLALAKSKADGNAVDVLRPLFCTVEVNLQSSSDEREKLSSIQSDFFLDPIWSNFSSVNVDAAAYAKLLVDNEQIIGDSNSSDGSQLKDLRDTFRAFMYPERSKADQDYVAELIKQKIVDEDFAKDVLFVDFTRPIFSPVRCGLLDAAKDVKDLSPQGIHDGILAAVTGRLADAPGAKDLAAALGDTNKDAHNPVVAAYMQKCSARGAALMPEAMEYGSYLRRAARIVRVTIDKEKFKDSNGDDVEGDFGIIDFNETLAVDKFETAALKADSPDRPFFDQSCTLQHGH
jgi:hypothetical protein